MYQQLTPYFGLILGVLPTFFAWLAAMVAGFCRSDGLNATWWGRLLNTGIALFALAFCVVVNLFIAQKLTLNLSTDLQAFEIGFTSLAFGAMKPLMTQIQSVVGFTPQGFVLFPQSQATSVVAQARQASALAPTQSRLQVVPRPPVVTNAANPPYLNTNLNTANPIIDNGDHAG